MTAFVQKTYSAISGVRTKYLCVASANYCCIFAAQLKSVGDN